MHALEPLIVYTGRSCCLCDELRPELELLAAELGLAVRWIQIDGDAGLEATYRESIPVAVYRGRRVFKYRLDEEQLRRRVAEAG